MYFMGVEGSIELHGLFDFASGGIMVESIVIMSLHSLSCDKVNNVKHVQKRKELIIFNFIAF